MAKRRKRNFKLPTAEQLPKPDEKQYANRPVQFSFKYLVSDHELFPLTRCEAKFLAALLTKLQFYGRMPVNEFVNPNNRDHRHQFNFSDMKVPTFGVNVDGDEIDEQEQIDENAWQFSISDEAQSKWRIYGFMAGYRFFIVWLDPNHAILASSDKE